MTQINFLVAFLAGLASFLAPCVVPLVPAYISFISGVSFSNLSNTQTASHYRNKVLINSLLYILGFSLIFVLLGLGATAIGKTLILNRQLVLKIGGLFIIFFGLYTIGIFNRWGLAQKEFHLQLSARLRKVKYLGSFLMGTTFAIAWTPCVGAILGAILTLAATSGNILQGGSLLFIYSLGISLPFLIIALTLSHSYKFLKSLGPKLQYISMAGGLLLVAIGVLMFSQRYDIVTGFLLGQLNRFEFFRNLQTSF